MVSFQCEACGDIFTKKKLDAHRGQCRGASFSCLDCMVHFNGTEYRSHTSCVTEAQKYQGNLYKEKAPKPQKRKSVTIAAEPIHHGPRDPYVEDAPDVDDDARKQNHRRSAGDSPPPPAPSPPPATPAIPTSSQPALTNGMASKPVNVFDFLDSSGTPTSASGKGGGDGPMEMVSHAPSVFDQSREVTRVDHGKDDSDAGDYDFAYEENGFSYGAGPIPPPSLYHNRASNVSMEFMTPAPKPRRKERAQPPPSLEHSRTSSLTGTSGGKRKRGQGQPQEDIPMADAPSTAKSASKNASQANTPSLNHSGLTGGLSQMMRTMSPDYEAHSDHEEYTHPPSPIKRTRRNKDQTHNNPDNGLGISIKGGAGRKLISLLGGATGVTAMNGSSNDPSSKALVRTRRRSSSDGNGDEKDRKAVRKQKHHKDNTNDSKRKRRTSNALVRTNGNHSDSDSDDERPRRLKAIEYKRSDDRSRSPQGTRTKHRDRQNGNGTNKQLVLYKQSDSDSDGDAADQKREKANQFLSIVNKGPDSERGCSVHKALKRYHREYSSSVAPEEHDQKGGEKSKERPERGRGRERGRGSRARDRRDVDEHDLWRLLRLRRNDRGEVVVFL